MRSLLLIIGLIAAACCNPAAPAAAAPRYRYLVPFATTSPVVHWWNSGNPPRAINAYTWRVWEGVDTGSYIRHDTVTIAEGRLRDSLHYAHLATLARYTPYP